MAKCPTPAINDGECVAAEKVIVMNNDKEGNDEQPRWKQLTGERLCLFCPLNKKFDKKISRTLYGPYTTVILARMCIIVIDTNLIRMVLYIQLVEKMGHPLVCYSKGTACTSKLRILRCAAFHYPVMMRFLKRMYKALSVYSVVKQIDTALGTGYTPRLCVLQRQKCLLTCSVMRQRQATCKANQGVAP